jgi:hypothetical protein
VTASETSGEPATSGESAPARIPPPFVDEHTVVINAPACAVWDVLVRPPARRRRIGAGVLARVLRLSDRDADRPGFAVTESDPPRRLLFTGRHRFSDYALEWTLRAQGEGTVLTARTYAAFPGWRGRTYRRLVIGSGGHRIAMRRWLTAVRRGSEPAARSRTIWGRPGPVSTGRRGGRRPRDW